MQLTGWAKNREDDTVELVAEGSKEALSAFMKACRKGPEIAWVTNVMSQWEEASGEFLTFKVI